MRSLIAFLAVMCLSVVAFGEDAKYRFPDWVLADPVGDNALITTTRLESSDKPLTESRQLFLRFSPTSCKYSGDKTVMQVARTEKEFNTIMASMVGIKAELPRKLDFDKELFIFVFNGTQDANEKTLVEVADVDRNGGAIKLGKKSFVGRDGKLVTLYDSIIVRVEVQIGIPGLVRDGYSPWTMIRVNKEKFFKEHPMSDETHFVLIEHRDNIYSQKETPVK
jgi:hypothetical protein